MHFEKSGAYTGEVSAEMLKSINVEYVIIGHSERRQYFNETDENVNKKVKAAIEHGLKPIVCVGETIKQRELGLEIDVVEQQVQIALQDIESNKLENIIFAYEPIWAIGTGMVATKEDANTIIKAIRNKIATMYNEEIAQNITILYGGSVNSKNAYEIFSASDIDGALVGGASLNVEEFNAIIEAI